MWRVESCHVVSCVSLSCTHRGRHIPQPFTPPYVLHTPDITHIKLSPEDRFVVLATDGLWDFLTDAEAVEIVHRVYIDSGGNIGTTSQLASQALIDAVLHKAAARLGMSVDELKEVPIGSKRRSKHDDTTAVVVFF